MAKSIFTLELAQKLYSDEEAFVVDFNDAWKWIGYTRKENAKDKLFNNFEEGLDFCTKGCKTSSAGRPSQSILLTVDCFKQLAMMAGTDTGKQIRRYFLECEKAAKAIASQQLNDPMLAQLKMMAQMREQQLDQERRLAQLEEVRAIAHKELIALPASSHDIPPESADMKVRRIVNNYCGATGINQSEVYRNLYQQHFYRYRRRVTPLERETKIQAFVRLGLIDSLYDLAVELFAQEVA